MNIISQDENKLLERKDVVATLRSDGTTITRESVKSELCKKFKVDSEQVIINSIQPTFGSLDVTIDAQIYDKKDAISKITAKHIMTRNAIAPVENTTEEVKEEVPAQKEEVEVESKEEA